MRPLRIVRPPPGRGVRGVLAPALNEGMEGGTNGWTYIRTPHGGKGLNKYLHSTHRDYTTLLCSNTVKLTTIQQAAMQDDNHACDECGAASCTKHIKNKTTTTVVRAAECSVNFKPGASAGNHLATSSTALRAIVFDAAMTHVQPAVCGISKFMSVLVRNSRAVIMTKLRRLCSQCFQ